MTDGKMDNVTEKKVDRTQSDGLLTVHAFSGIFRMAAQLVSMMILVPIIIENVGKEKYGVWTLGMAIMGILAFLEFGLVQASNRFLAAIDFNKQPEQMKQWTCTTFWLTFASGVLVMITGFLFSSQLATLFNVPESIHEEATFVVFIFIWRLAISIPLRNFSAVLMSQRYMARAHFAQGASTILYFVSGIWVLHHGYGLNGLAIAFLLTMLVEHFTYAIMSVKIVPLSSYSLKYFNFQLISRIIEFSVFAWLGQITNLVFQRAGVLIVNLTSGLAANGAYSIAVRLSSISGELAAQVTYAGSPKITRLSVDENDGLGQAGWLTLTLARRAMLLSGILAAIATPLGGCFLEGWVGHDVAGLATVPLAIMTMSIFLGTPYNAAANSLSLAGEHRYTNIVALIVVSIYLIGLYALYLIDGEKYLGPTGVAIMGILSTVCFMMPAFIIRLKKHMDISFFRWVRYVYWPHLIPFSISFTIAYGVSIVIHSYVESGRVWMFISAFAGIIIGLIYLTIFSCFTAPSEERGMLRKVFVKLGVVKKVDK